MTPRSAIFNDLEIKRLNLDLITDVADIHKITVRGRAGVGLLQRWLLNLHTWPRRVCRRSESALNALASEDNTLRPRAISLGLASTPQFQPLSGQFFGSSLYPSRGANVSFYFRFASPRMGEASDYVCAAGGSFDSVRGFCVCSFGKYMTPTNKVRPDGVVNLTEVVNWACEDCPIGGFCTDNFAYPEVRALPSGWPKPPKSSCICRAARAGSSRVPSAALFAFLNGDEAIS